MHLKLCAQSQRTYLIWDGESTFCLGIYLQCLFINVLCRVHVPVSEKKDSVSVSPI